MALLLTDGTYLRLKLNEIKLLSDTISYNLYKDATTRETEKTAGALPPFTQVIGEQAVCPSFNLDAPLAGASAAKDEIAALAYQALKADVYPTAIDA
jgi:hypothetical protein